MRAATIVAAVSVAGVLAACSKPQSYSDDSLARDLDLALSQRPANTAVVSQVEGAPKPKPQAHAAAHHSHVAQEVARAKQAPSSETAPVAVAPAEVAPAPVPDAVQDAPAAEPEVVTEAKPEPQDAPEPAPEPTRRGGGRWPGGIGFPGGGVIIIRGGAGSADDPCDERDHPRRGRGGVLINPTFPGMPTGGGSRFPGGIILR